MEVSVGGSGNSDGNGDGGWGCDGNYVDGAHWAVIGDEPRPGVK